MKKRYGRWSVLSGPVHGYFLCRCDCGTVRDVRKGSLTEGISNSCGCLRREMSTLRTTHGHARLGSVSRTYITWKSMIARCSDVKSPQYKVYGARGITVCRRWKAFENFLADMGERPDQMTLERKNNRGNYTPSNCRWASAKEQARNRRSTHWVVIDGRRMSIAAACELRGVPYRRTYERIHRQGWSPERALT